MAFETKDMDLHEFVADIEFNEESDEDEHKEVNEEVVAGRLEGKEDDDEGEDVDSSERAGVHVEKTHSDVRKFIETKYDEARVMDVITRREVRSNSARKTMLRYESKVAKRAVKNLLDYEVSDMLKLGKAPVGTEEVSETLFSGYAPVKTEKFSDKIVSEHDSPPKKKVTRRQYKTRKRETAPSCSMSGFVDILEFEDDSQ